jgi:predicted phosphodiesterase
MRIWVLSDLHLSAERGWDILPPHERPAFDVLVVAGDLVTRMERGVRWLADRVDQRVLYLAGNHEPYGEDIDLDLQKARKASLGTSVTVVQDEAVVVDDVTFVAATFWTNFGLFGNPQRSMDHAAEKMNDYHKIRKDGYSRRLRPVDTLARNLKSRQFFAEAAAMAQTEKVVAITHHCPHELGLKAGTETDPVSSAYVNTGCEHLIAKFDLWIFGHTHQTRSFTVGDTWLVTNGKGYGLLPDGTRDNPNFDPRFTVDV